MVYFVNAFSSEYFHGNTAAVLLLPDFPAAASMQALAKEFGFSETVFLKHLGANRYHIRWFTPEVEVALCGHGSLAAAKVLFEHYATEAHSLEFASLSGILGAEKRDSSIWLNFPVDEPKPYIANPEIISAVSPITPLEILRSSANKNLVLIYDNPQQISGLKPDFPALLPLATEDLHGIAVSAIGHSPQDYICRYFAPWEGINEDPVTGSAQTCLAPYWAKILGKKELIAFQASERGGLFQLLLNNDRLLIGGEAFIYMRGELDGSWISS